MTLLIALMLNAVIEHQTGATFIHQGWICAIWVVHLLARQ